VITERRLIGKRIHPRREPPVTPTLFQAGEKQTLAVRRKNAAAGEATPDKGQVKMPLRYEDRAVGP
jgi:hypothetical protein